MSGATKMSRRDKKQKSQSRSEREPATPSLATISYIALVRQADSLPLSPHPLRMVFSSSEGEAIWREQKKLGLDL